MVGAIYTSFLFFLIGSLVFTVVIYMMFPFLVGEQFMPARPLLVYFIFANGFVGMYYAVAGFFFFTSKTKFIAITTIASGLFSIVAMWILGHLFGINGVAFGYLLSQILMFVLAWRMASWIYPMPWTELKLSMESISVIYKKL